MKTATAAKEIVDALRRPVPKAVGRTLVACLRNPDWNSVPPELRDQPGGLDPRVLPAVAAQHRVAGAVHASLKHARWLEPTVLAEIAKERGEVLGRHVRDVAELRRFGDLFGAAGIPWLVFKGPVLAGYMYPRPDLRSSTDIDLLVRPSDASAAFDLLERHGYRAVGNWSVLEHYGAAEIPMLSPWGTFVDLHWALVYEESIRSDFRIPTHRIFEGAREVPIGGCPTPTMGAVDTVVHIALHAGLDGGTRLVWLKDIEQAIARDRVAWSDIAARAQEWRVGPVVGLMLARCSRFLGLPVPADVLRELCPGRTWRVVESVTDRLSPVPRLAAGPSLARIVSRATRSTSSASHRALMQKVGLGGAHRVSRRAVPSPWLTEMDEQAHAARAAVLRTAGRS